MSRTRSAVVVGAGIGGLAVTLALRKVGIEARVLEQAPTLREVGAGIALWPNAMRTLAELGVGAAVLASTHPLRFMLGKTAAGAELTRLDAWTLLGEGQGPRIVHRADLHAILAQAVGPAAVTTSARVARVASGASPARVLLDSGAVIEGDIIIGADGLHSRVRPFVVDDKPRSAEQVCYRAVVDMDVAQHDTITEIQGAGLRCAPCPLGPHRMYWWATEHARGARDIPQEQRKDRVLARFAAFPAEFLDAVRATPPEAILLNELFDRAPVARWHRDNVVLLGDAAHPTTPNLGQGANMALDDALVLARALRDAPDAEAAFVRYERERVPRARHIVNLSRRFGAVAAWQNPAAVALREALLRAMPRAMLEGEVLKQIGEDVGTL